jgi:NAD(P)-dependent dehydrogenase (short-subunit alcohol dehydrogenase family)
VAGALLSQGWRVISIARHVPDSPVTTNSTGLADKNRDCSYIASDLATEEGVTEATAKVFALTSRLDLLVNNAGAINVEERFNELSYGDFERSFRLNLMAGFFLARGLRVPLSNGEYPSVVNIGSVYGRIPDTDVVPYCLSKAAVPLLTQMMARTFGPEIRANCILPGHIDTEMTCAAPVEFLDAIRKATILKRIGRTAEIAEIVSFLASSGAAFLTGTAIVADGGYMAGR